MIRRAENRGPLVGRRERREASAGIIEGSAMEAITISEL